MKNRNRLHRFNQKDHQIIDYIQKIDQTITDVRVYGNKSAFGMHVILKLLCLGLSLFKNQFALLTTQNVSLHISAVIIVFQFWMTKNFVGKKLLGLKWYFADDKYGTQRLMVQCRANQQLVQQSHVRLFWVIQTLYVIWPLIVVWLYIILIPTLVNQHKTSVNMIILMSAVSNFYYFWKARDVAYERQSVLKSKIGIDNVRKMDLGSIVTHY